MNYCFVRSLILKNFREWKERTKNEDYNIIIEGEDKVNDSMCLISIVVFNADKNIHKSKKIPLSIKLNLLGSFKIILHIDFYCNMEHNAEFIYDFVESMRFKLY